MNPRIQKSRILTLHALCKMQVKPIGTGLARPRFSPCSCYGVLVASFNDWMTADCAMTQKPLGPRELALQDHHALAKLARVRNTGSSASLRTRAEGGWVERRAGRAHCGGEGSTLALPRPGPAGERCCPGSRWARRRYPGRGAWGLSLAPFFGLALV